MRTKFERRLDELYAYARIAQFCDLAWERLQPGQDAEVLWDTLNIFQLWAKERKQSLPLAVIECCAACGLIGQGEREQLVRELGEEQRRLAKPKFNREAGKLEFEGRLVRTVQIRKKPTEPFLILDAFENAGWTESIGMTGIDSIYNAVYRLNGELQDLEFFVRDRKIHWRIANRDTIAVLAR